MIKKLFQAIGVAFLLFVVAPISVVTVLGLSGALDEKHPTPPAPSVPAETNSDRQDSGDVTLVASSGANILIWNDDKSFDEAMKLLDAGIQKTHPELLTTLLACRVPGGSKIVVINGGFFSSIILVVSGKDTGCRGAVDNGNIKYHA